MRGAGRGGEVSGIGTGWEICDNIDWGDNWGKWGSGVSASDG